GAAGLKPDAHRAILGDCLLQRQAHLACHRTQLAERLRCLGPHARLGVVHQHVDQRGDNFREQFWIVLTQFLGGAGALVLVAVALDDGQQLGDALVRIGLVLLAEDAGLGRCGQDGKQKRDQEETAAPHVQAPMSGEGPSRQRARAERPVSPHSLASATRTWVNPRKRESARRTTLPSLLSPLQLTNQRRPPGPGPSCPRRAFSCRKYSAVWARCSGVPWSSRSRRRKSRSWELTLAQPLLGLLTGAPWGRCLRNSSMRLMSSSSWAICS